ncbi:MAG TPA: hypothetical protein VN026_10650 [Bacteroidia bacterium]|jgi:hypothetical protein|nr:hypothetical protein [Bacteroidia bacterium]
MKTAEEIFLKHCSDIPFDADLKLAMEAYASQFQSTPKKSIDVTDEYILKQAVNYTDNFDIKFTSDQQKKIAQIDFSEGFKKAVSLSNPVTNKSEPVDAVKLIAWIRTCGYEKGNHYTNGSLWYHNFKPDLTDTQLVELYKQSLKEK